MSEAGSVQMDLTEYDHTDFAHLSRMMKGVYKRGSIPELNFPAEGVADLVYTAITVCPAPRYKSVSGIWQAACGYACLKASCREHVHLPSAAASIPAVQNVGFEAADSPDSTSSRPEMSTSSALDYAGLVPSPFLLSHYMERMDHADRGWNAARTGC